MTSDFTGLAQYLTNAKMGTGNIPPSIQDLPKFLSTTDGRRAVRSSIDSMIARQKMLGIQPENAHEEIIKSLMGQMPGASNATATPSSPMPSMQTPNSQMGPDNSGVNSFQPMGQEQSMLGMSSQGVGI